jgi:phosphoserine phosphatase RsbU/P
LLVLLFLRYDFLTALLAGLTLDVTLPALFLIRSGNAGIEIQGWLVFLVVALPMLLSLRYLLSGKEFVYRYDDIPAHVRRIAERERQRVELETARRIQSSILPELPPRIAGMDIAHAYLPASEVGGDFYDVLALDDGRLAIAIGDVAGHGVSSGLVMSGAKSALAVQVTFNPEVLAVFETLNRMVYQSARKRLITTLCYALVDPVRREMTFASAGHLYPYVVSQDGRVRALQSTAYPLGVRPELEIAVTKEGLQAGDTLVMLSDGIVEAHPESSLEPFGFPRIEKTLSILAQETVEKLRDGLLSELDRYVGPAPREDDQTLLVLRIP